MLKPKLTSLLGVTLAIALSVLAFASHASAAPAQVTLHLDGTHPVDVDYHQGTFTATPPLCASGAWLGNGAGSRVFTCADGSGTFTADFPGELEHVQGATGPWAFISGTGSYTALRGNGKATIDASTGVNTSPIVFSDTWTGSVDFDMTPPTGSITAVKVTHPRSARGRWHAAVLFSAHDNVDSNPVNFSATATAGRFYATRNGTVTTGAGTFTIAFRTTKHTHLLRIEIQLSDPWGNQTTLAKTIRFR